MRIAEEEFRIADFGLRKKEERISDCGKKEKLQISEEVEGISDCGMPISEKKEKLQIRKKKKKKKEFRIADCRLRKKKLQIAEKVIVDREIANQKSKVQTGAKRSSAKLNPKSEI